MKREAKTIVLIHGLWVTPRSWDLFRSFYEAEGYQVLAPAWPRMPGEVEEVRRNPSALAKLGVMEIADHYEKILRSLDSPPILIGHSFGGLIVQMLLDRGLGAVGVAIDSAAPKGVLRLPLSTVKSASPVLSNPLNYWRTVGLTFKQFCYTFANTMSENDARAAYDRYAIPSPGRPLFQVAFANFNPWAATRVDFGKNDRAPLLFIAATEDNQVPPSINRSNHRHYGRANAITEFKEFPNRSHLLIAQDGWEEIAEYALSWAVAKLGGTGLQGSRVVRTA